MTGPGRMSERCLPHSQTLEGPGGAGPAWLGLKCRAWVELGIEWCLYHIACAEPIKCSPGPRTGVGSPVLSSEIHLQTPQGTYWPAQ